MATTHRTTIEVSPSVPAELLASADLNLRITVSCRAGCDLRGLPVTVVAADEVLITSDLASYEERGNVTEAFTLKAPSQAGAHAWAIAFPRHEVDGVIHEESRLVVTFTTHPHPTSMAVWDVPAPVVMNRSFKVKVGVKCSEKCPLAGQVIEVGDEAGTRMGEGTLGETPWPGTSALYVAEVQLKAPITEGMFSWSARFGSGEPGLPHEDAAAAFSFRTARPPEHRVTVKVTEQSTESPLDNVDVRLGVYRASTDAAGLACLELPGGVYELDAWKAGYTTPPRTVEVLGDLELHITALSAPEKDPDEERVWM